MIGIVDYGSGNIKAIANIYNRLNVPYTIISKPEDLHLAERIILPGVGDFDTTMSALINSGLKKSLEDEVLVKGKLFLGICVGMQILGQSSEEGSLSGLSWINGKIVKMDTTKLNNKPLLPHMGWNSLKLNSNHPIFADVDLDRGFYFIHSFCFNADSSENVLATSFYGQEFVSAINFKNIIGVQFHPEKSHSNGVTLLSNFSKLSIC